MPAGKAPILNLTREDLESLGVTTKAMVASIEHLIRERAVGRVESAPKLSITPGDGRLFMSMMAVSENPPFMAVKALGMNPANTKAGIASIGALINLFDAQTGLPLATMDGTWITAVRTAALSGVAAKRLASPDAGVVGFVGCGVQARSHFNVMADLFPVREIRVSGRSAGNRDRLCRLARDRGVNAVACSSPDDAIVSADIIVTTVPDTGMTKPFLAARTIKPNAFVAMVDLARSWLPEEIDAFDRLYIDDREQESLMSQTMVHEEHIDGDLASLVLSALPESLSEQRTAFAFRGVALADLALAGLCYELATVEKPQVQKT